MFKTKKRRIIDHLKARNRITVFFYFIFLVGKQILFKFYIKVVQIGLLGRVAKKQGFVGLFVSLFARNIIWEINVCFTAFVESVHVQTVPDGIAVDNVKKSCRSEASCLLISLYFS